jgi:hypothetical protein
MLQDFELLAETELRLELASTGDDGGRGGEVVTVLLLEVHKNHVYIYINTMGWVHCRGGW